MAVSTIKAMTGRKRSEMIDFTPTNGNTYQDGCFYGYVNGNVFVSVRLSGLTANSRVAVFQLPSGYRPPVQINVTGHGGTSISNKCYGVINSDGNISVNSEDEYAFFQAYFPIGS